MFDSHKSNHNTTIIMSTEFDKQFTKIIDANGFIAALDQSGGSTPKALRLYGIPDDAYVAGEESMFDAVHEMRARIMTSDVFNGNRILGSILFENTIEREVGIAVGVELADGLLGVPRGGDLTLGIAGGEQPDQLGVGALVEAFLRHDEQLADAVERIVLVAPMPESLLLHAAADQVQLLASQAHQVERVRDLDGIGQHGVEHLAVRAGHVQGRVGDLRPPGRVALCQPSHRRQRVAAFHDIEQLSTADIDDRGRPLLCAPLPTLADSVSSSPSAVT